MARGFVIEDSRSSTRSSAPPPSFQRHSFNTGLCECGEHCSSCAEVMFCPWCQLSAQYNMLTHQTRGVNSFMCCGMLLMDSCMTFGFCIVAMSVFTRSQATSQFVLTDEGACVSCLKSCCCASCSACQVHREMSLRSRFPGGVCVSEAFTRPGLLLEAPHPLSMNSEGYAYAAPLAPVPLLLYYPPQQQHVAMVGNYVPPHYAHPPGYHPTPPPLYASQDAQPPYTSPPQTNSIYGQAPLGYSPARPYGQAAYTTAPSRSMFSETGKDVE
jgi:Cys-rich protein (TIGR01571 family)